MEKYSILLLFLIIMHSQLVMSSKIDKATNTKKQLIIPRPRFFGPIVSAIRAQSTEHIKSNYSDIESEEVCEIDRPSYLLSLIQTETLIDISFNIDNTYILKSMDYDSINSIYPLHEAIMRWVLCENNFKTLDRVDNNYFQHIDRIIYMIGILRKNKANIFLKKNGQTPLEFFESEKIRNHLGVNPIIQLLLSSASKL